MLMAGVAFEHVGMVAAHAVRFGVPLQIGLLLVHAVAVGAGDLAVRVGFRQLVRVDGGALRIGERGARAAFRCDFILIVSAQAH